MQIINTHLKLGLIQTWYRFSRQSTLLVDTIPAFLYNLYSVAQILCKCFVFAATDLSILSGENYLKWWSHKVRSSSQIMLF